MKFTNTGLYNVDETQYTNAYNGFTVSITCVLDIFNFIFVFGKICSSRCQHLLWASCTHQRIVFPWIAQKIFMGCQDEDSCPFDRAARTTVRWISFADRPPCTTPGWQNNRLGTWHSHSSPKTLHFFKPRHLVEESGAEPTKQRPQFAPKMTRANWEGLDMRRPENTHMFHFLTRSTGWWESYYQDRG